ncbi:MAG: carbon storage regulator CsrA [Rhodothermaceae bacterium]
MLVLKRKTDEKIRIGSDIVINIVSISEHQVKIGIEAPDDVKILREEIYETVKNDILEATEKSKEIKPDLSDLSVNKLNKKSDKQ